MSMDTKSLQVGFKERADFGDLHVTKKNRVNLLQYNEISFTTRTNGSNFPELPLNRKTLLDEFTIFVKSRQIMIIVIIMCKITDTFISRACTSHHHWWCRRRTEEGEATRNVIFS